MADKPVRELMAHDLDAIIEAGVVEQQHPIIQQLAAQRMAQVHSLGKLASKAKRQGSSRSH